MSNKINESSANPELEPLLVSVKTACRLLGIGHSKLYELIAAGVIKSKKIGGKRLLDYQSLKAAAG
jgi:excisionase family DNA binding protein